MGFQGKGIERLSDDQRSVKDLEKQICTRELEFELLKKVLDIFPKIEK